MSRSADDAASPSLAKQSEATRADHRSAPLHENTVPELTPTAQDTVTRDEMIKLFGSALRVR